MLRVSLMPSPLGVNTGAALSLAGMVSDDWPADSWLTTGGVLSPPPLLPASHSSVVMLRSPVAARR